VKADVVAIVPARGGSRSIPRKNVRLLGGVPLLAYSIEAGLAARLVDRVVVSTDDEEIAAIARQFGAEVPFMRPASLAEDGTPDLPVFQHALDWLETHEQSVPDIVVQLRPTSPLRPPDCIDAAIALLRDDSTADSVRAVVRASQSPYKMWHLEADGGMVPLVCAGARTSTGADAAEPYNLPRQMLPAAFWQTGHVDAIWTATIRDKKSMSGSRIRPLVIESVYSCDIDTEADWQRAEWMLARVRRPIASRPIAGRRANQGVVPGDVRLIVFDFDGVMTDNRVWVAQNGEEWVACDRSDGLGLERVRGLGVELYVLSTERHPVVGVRCQKLGLEYKQSLSNKGQALRELMTARGLDPAQVVYVGNDVNDLDCMRLVGCGVAVADAHPDVLAEADVVLTRSGGHGAVRELCDRLAAQKMR
jgi:N-acylneuraminate cytidylyltransferase